MTPRTRKYIRLKKLRKARKRILTKHKKAWETMGASASLLSSYLKEAGDSIRAYAEAYNNSFKNN